MLRLPGLSVTPHFSLPMVWAAPQPVPHQLRHELADPGPEGLPGRRYVYTLQLWSDGTLRQDCDLKLTLNGGCLVFWDGK